MELFGTDGVRGLAGDKLNAFMVMKIAIGLLEYILEKSKNN